MELFQRLGNEIESLWRAENYNEEHLPAIAADALRRADIPSKISGWDVIRWTIGQSELPPQKDLHANFGDPPITLFTGPRFYIDVYFWLEGTTATHQHSFCGAFQVLMGSSIHSWYEFERREAINAYMEIGDMSLKVCELLEKSDVQEIRDGRRYIHSLFHLDQPSATIVVRTDNSPLSMPQFSYHKPSLALDPFFEHAATTKKLQCVATLFRTNQPDTDEVVNAMLAESDLQTSYAVLRLVRDVLRADALGEMFKLAAPSERFEQFVKTVADRHGEEKAAVLKAVFNYGDDLAEIVRRRSVVTNPEHRFFLALLLNVEGRGRIYSLIKQRFHDADPLEKVLDWTFDLAQTRIAGTQATNALGIENFDDADLFVLENLLKERSGQEITETYALDYGTERAAGVDIESKIARIKDSVIFRPLLQM